MIGAYYFCNVDIIPDFFFHFAVYILFSIDSNYDIVELGWNYKYWYVTIFYYL